MNILVTGGAGFIGRHLVNELLKHDHDITVLDSFRRGKQNFDFLLNNGVKLIHDDVRNNNLMDDLIDKSDVVFHLAAVSRVLPSIENPIETFLVNVVATEAIARKCSEVGTKMIFSSSREVYGNPSELPVDEDFPFDPQNPYGASKASAELILSSYEKTYGLNYISLRLSNVYGNGDFERVIPIFVEKFLNDEDVYVYGSDKVIDFIDVDTVVKAMNLTVKAKNGAYNLSSGVGTTIMELANKLKEMTDSSSKIHVKPNRSNEIERFIGNSNKIKNELNLKINTVLYSYIKKNILLK